MSLATDILKHSGSLIPSRKIERREPLSYPKRRAIKSKTRKHVEVVHISGVSLVPQRNMWSAYFYNGEKTIRIGEFPTQERAAIARKIYLHWRKLGMKDIPHIPEKRQYVLWRASDKS